MSSKRCFKCQQDLPVESFYKHSGMSGGLLGKCKECAKNDVRKNRAANLDYYKAFDRGRAMLPHRVEARKRYSQTEAGKRAHQKALRKQVELHPEKRKARQAVSNAIRDGRMFPMPCIVCGKNAEAHHPDYSQPLYVIWLCTTHHREVHKAMAEDRQDARDAA